ncbi:MAG: hypothetical protein OEW62_01215 [Candidatus Bathyarchaeota archaeon]|nr:hypothetical protein [Candidatus Bathyarchaeota archaeon]MDH5595213.1 hypothetical protein [Candidatus Bathyarchaeota archaeon]
MPVSFREGYRAICWFYVEMQDSDWRRKFAITVFSHLGEVDPYFGVCFGKFSRVVDFYHRSAKVASHFLGTLSKKLSERNIHVSQSLVLCKPFIEPEPEKTKDSKIRAYTFFKPRSKDLILSGMEAVSRLGQENRETFNVPYRATYWNNSCFPLMVITYGDSYADVVDSIRQNRMQADWAMDSSTFVSLRVSSETLDPVRDERVKAIPAIVFAKPYSFPNIDHVNFRKWNVKTLGWPGCKERFGWFDICDSLEFTSLYDLQRYIINFKKDPRHKIRRTSTLLLKARKQ